jgi:hypothetical protein
MLTYTHRAFFFFPFWECQEILTVNPVMYENKQAAIKCLSPANETNEVQITLVCSREELLHPHIVKAFAGSAQYLVLGMSLGVESIYPCSPPLTVSVTPNLEISSVSHFCILTRVRTCSRKIS